jgi:hypothetical protein
VAQLTDMPDAVDSARQRKTLRRGSRAMTTVAGSHAVEAGSRLHVLGVTTVVAGILGAAYALVDTSRADAVDNSYGVPMVAIGLGLVVAGLGLARRPVLAGAGRWLPLIMGGYVFVVMFPAVFGPLVAGRIAIGVWMLMFVALGASLVRAGSGWSR